MKPVAYFLSEATLKERTVVSNNVDTKLLNQTIWDCQEQYIQPMLGDALYTRLVTGIDAEDLTAQEEALINDYITNALIFYVMAELPMVLGYKFYNKNILKKTAEGSESLSMSEIADLMKYYKNKAEFYAQRAIKYLEENASETLFSQYYDSEDIMPESSGYKCAFVLNNDDDE
jgi:hypothetical protein